MTRHVSKEHDAFLYHQVIQMIRDMQDNGTLKAGEKLPSLRNLASKLSVSVPTIKQAYMELERQNIIYAREKSGYFLNPSQSLHAMPSKARAAQRPVPVNRQELIEQVYQGIHTPGNLSLGVANPVAALPASKALNRAMRRVMTLAGDTAFEYGPMLGFEPLRQQLAMSYLDFGLQVSPDELIVTNGAQEAICLALQTVAKPGDVIAVETPCYFGILELIESLGMLALELPLDAQNGMALEDLQRAIDTHPVSAVVLSSTIANPLGCRLPDDRKRSIVELLESREIALIEDDVYGDLYFSGNRGTPMQAFSRRQLVLTCSSFSKTAAPGYRTGWLLAPGFCQQVQRLKRAMSFSASLLNQYAISEFVRSGEYQRYLKQLRQTLLTNRDRMIAFLRTHLPDSVRISTPAGGTVLWLEFERERDGDALFRQALAERISIAPGSLFSPSLRYKHCVRISFGLPWNENMERGLVRLCELFRTNN